MFAPPTERRLPEGALERRHPGPSPRVADPAVNSAHRLLDRALENEQMIETQLECLVHEQDQPRLFHDTSSLVGFETVMLMRFHTVEEAQRFHHIEERIDERRWHCG